MLERVHRLPDPVPDISEDDLLSQRRAGDAARDRRDWAEAARAYRAHLALQPGDAAIWVQFGHALKEENRISEAEGAYRRAVALQPDDADAHVQLGRALRRAGADGPARREFRTALELAASDDARRELVGMGEAELAEELAGRWLGSDAADVTYFELADLFGFLNAHPTLSGIQRVMVNVIEQILSLPASEAAAYRFVIGSAEQPLRVVDPAALLRVIRYATAPAMVHARLRELVAEAEAEAGACAVQPAAGQTYFALGAFWVTPDFFPRYVAMKTAGVRIGAYLYDLIPVNHREFCDTLLSRRFGLALGETLLCLDFVLTISEHTAREMRVLLDQSGLPDLPVRAVPLAHALQLPRPGAPRWTPAIEALRNTRFVLTVSTIEVRKNHTYLFRAWREMLRNGEEVPELVIVGRPGWRVDDLMAQLRDTDFLDGHIHLLHDLTDDELATLYRSCLFTVFPSFTEGWGLPVGESLSYGTPCVASRAASIPEVGGELVDYVDPHDLGDGLRVIRALLHDKDALQARRDAIASAFRPRDWKAVTRDLCDALAAAAQGTPEAAPLRRPALAAGQVFEPAALRPERPLPRDYLRRPLRAMLPAHWHESENFGAWMRGEEGSIVFRAGSAMPGETLIVYLHLLAAPQVDGHVLTVSPPDARMRRSPGRDEDRRVRSITLQPNTSAVLRVLTRAGEDGVVDLRLSVDRPTGNHGDDPRRIALGLVRLAWAPADDLATRQEITERFLLDPLPA
ncbi:glycosyltransferase [Roseomonas sp. BN140053]|uniref:glycosyltransferase family 4 protein n=1 Tax=Roseomonas sp. BN140053 TaxID=3391898 RepID=UPI0039EA6284